MTKARGSLVHSSRPCMLAPSPHYCACVCTNIWAHWASRPVQDGTTLRQYLATRLRCDPMRVTKKFGGNGEFSVVRKRFVFVCCSSLSLIPTVPVSLHGGPLGLCEFTIAFSFCVGAGGPTRPAGKTMFRSWEHSHVTAQERGDAEAELRGLEAAFWAKDREIQQQQRQRLLQLTGSSEPPSQAQGSARRRRRTARTTVRARHSVEAEDL